MPMRLKSDLYKKEQEEVIEKIISILDLKNKNTYTLYELDKNEEIQNKIMELIPEIRKWFIANYIFVNSMQRQIPCNFVATCSHCCS